MNELFYLIRCFNCQIVKCNNAVLKVSESFTIQIKKDQIPMLQNYVEELVHRYLLLLEEIEEVIGR